MLVLCSSLCTAQYINNLHIATPPEIAGNYPALQLDLGSVASPIVTGTATFAADETTGEITACTPNLQGLTDRIAFVDKDTCNFLSQALNVQSAGAIAIIVCNKQEDVAGHYVGALEGNISDLNIPAFLMPYTSCKKIRTVLESDETAVELNFLCEQAAYDSEVIWGDLPGQGDFEGGLNGWTVVNDIGSDTTWAWTDRPIIPGEYGDAAPGGSACNGYMSFPSDYYATLAGGDGIPLCISNGTQFCSGSLISPNIDLAGLTLDGLFVGIRHDVRYWLNGSTSLIVSYDDGLTWPDSIVISSGVDAAGEANPEVGNNPDCIDPSSPANQGINEYLQIPVPNYQGQSTIKLQFRHLGAYYYATIDDVTLINKRHLDIELRRNIYAQAPARRIPFDQRQEIPLLVDVSNKGNILASNTKIEAHAFDANAVLEATYEGPTYPDLPVLCYQDHLLPFSQTHVPQTIGKQSITYVNVTDGDSVTENDTLSFPHTIVDNNEPWVSVDRPLPNTDDTRYGGYRNIFTGGAFNREEASSYAYAVAYPFYLPAGDKYFLDCVRFGVNERVTNSGDVRVYLYLWNPTEGNSFASDREAGEYTIHPDDRLLIGCMGQNTFGSRENSQPLSALLLILDDKTDMTIKMAIADPTTGQPRLDEDKNIFQLPLFDDQLYALVFVYNPSEPYFLEMLAGAAPPGSINDRFGYNVAMDKLGKPYRAGTCYSGLQNGGDFESELSQVTLVSSFNNNNVWVEMSFSNSLHGGYCSFTSSSENLAETDLSVEIYPNPTRDKFYINLNQQHPTSTLSFELINSSGQILKRKNETGVIKGTYEMDVSQIPAGLYTLRVKTDHGIITEKVTIAK